LIFSRKDGRPSKQVPAYRRIIPFLMRGRNESAVYFEQAIDLSATLPWLDRFNRDRQGSRRATLFHLTLSALAEILHERPRLNRFVAGRRLHDRDGVYISFAAKKQMDDDAPLSVVKRRFEPGERFAEMVDALAADIDAARSDEKSAVDRELAVLLRLPPWLLDIAVRGLRALDAVNLAPQALLDSDPMYTSVFVANLGSLKIDAAYHHLYEWGNCPLFATIGAIERVPVAGEGDVVEVRPVAKIKYSYDERIEDGLYAARALAGVRRRLEDPCSWIAELATTNR
jgi:hypothetical protein